MLLSRPIDDQRPESLIANTLKLDLSAAEASNVDVRARAAGLFLRVAGEIEACRPWDN